MGFSTLHEPLHAELDIPAWSLTNAGLTIGIQFVIQIPNTGISELIKFETYYECNLFEAASDYDELKNADYHFQESLLIGDSE